MEKLYIGRIKLSKEDSDTWTGKPPFMYVTSNSDRANIDKAILFRDEKKCENELRKNFITHKHYPESKMQIVELTVKIDGIKDI
jgi:hypothetical protein